MVVMFAPVRKRVKGGGSDGERLFCKIKFKIYFFIHPSPTHIPNSGAVSGARVDWGWGAEEGEVYVVVARHLVPTEAHLPRHCHSPQFIIEFQYFILCNRHTRSHLPP